MVCNRDQQSPVFARLGYEPVGYDRDYDIDGSVQPLSAILPGVINEIQAISRDPVAQARRNLTDLQHRKAQGDVSVSDASIAEARAWVEDEQVAQGFVVRGDVEFDLNDD